MGVENLCRHPLRQQIGNGVLDAGLPRSMASRILSHFLPSNGMVPSIYEDLRAGDDVHDADDVEERAGMAIDEENLGTRYQDQDYDLNDALFAPNDSQLATESTAFIPPTNTPRTKKGKGKRISRSPRILGDDDGDDDVPQSLLIEEEAEDMGGPSQPAAPRISPEQGKPGPVPEQRPVDDNGDRARSVPLRPGVFSASPKEKAMWMWINVTNLDRFMGEVYAYYRGAGIWCICLDRLINILYDKTALSWDSH